MLIINKNLIKYIMKNNLRPTDSCILISTRKEFRDIVRNLSIPANNVFLDVLFNFIVKDNKLIFSFKDITLNRYIFKKGIKELIDTDIVNLDNKIYILNPKMFKYVQ